MPSHVCWSTLWHLVGWVESSMRGKTTMYLLIKSQFGGSQAVVVLVKVSPKEDGAMLEVSDCGGDVLGMHKLHYVYSTSRPLFKAY